MANIVGGVFGFIIGIAIILLLGWIFLSYCQYKMAKKARGKYAWIAFIPIISSFHFFSVAGMSWLWGFSMIIPPLYFVALVIAVIKISRRFGQRGWFGLLFFNIPLVYWAMYKLASKNIFYIEEPKTREYLQKILERKLQDPNFSLDNIKMGAELRENLEKNLKKIPNSSVTLVGEDGITPLWKIILLFLFFTIVFPIIISFGIEKGLEDIPEKAIIGFEQSEEPFQNNMKILENNEEFETEDPLSKMFVTKDEDSSQKNKEIRKNNIIQTNLKAIQYSENQDFINASKTYESFLKKHGLIQVDISQIKAKVKKSPSLNGFLYDSISSFLRANTPSKLSDKEKAILHNRFQVYISNRSQEYKNEQRWVTELQNELETFKGKKDDEVIINEIYDTEIFPQEKNQILTQELPYTVSLGKYKFENNNPSKIEIKSLNAEDSQVYKEKGSNEYKNEGTITVQRPFDIVIIKQDDEVLMAPVFNSQTSVVLSFPSTAVSYLYKGNLESNTLKLPQVKNILEKSITHKKFPKLIELVEKDFLYQIKNTGDSQQIEIRKLAQEIINDVMEK